MLKCNNLRVPWQDEYRTVAEAYQAAVVSLLEMKEEKFRESHFYWAAFLLHGFADVMLDDGVLESIRKFVESEEGEEETQSSAMGVTERGAGDNDLLKKSNSIGLNFPALFRGADFGLAGMKRLLSRTEEK